MNTRKKNKKQKEPEWIKCHECIYRKDCETREMREGCFLGDREKGE